MDTQPAFGFRQLVPHIVGDMANAVAERNGEDQQRQSARAEVAARMIMALLPRDVIEAMLAGQCVMLHEMMIDCARDTLCGEADTARRGARSTLVALDKAFRANLDRLRHYQARPAQARGDRIAAPTSDLAGHTGPTPLMDLTASVRSASSDAVQAESAGVDPRNALADTPGGEAIAETAIAPGVAPGIVPRIAPETAPAFASGISREPTKAVPVTNGIPARRQAMPEMRTPEETGAVPQTGRPQRQTAEPGAAREDLATAAAAIPFRPSPEAIAACRANPEAMAALQAGDPGRFARAMGIDRPSEDYLVAAVTRGGPFRRPVGESPPVAAQRHG